MATRDDAAGTAVASDVAMAPSMSAEAAADSIASGAGAANATTSIRPPAAPALPAERPQAVAVGDQRADSRRAAPASPPLPRSAEIAARTEAAAVARSSAEGVASARRERATDAAFAADPRPATVSGRVTDAQGVPLASASITVVGRDTASATTDSSGRYVITDIAPGTYELRGRRTGYAPARDTLRVSAANAAAADLTLRASPAELQGAVVTTATGSQPAAQAAKVRPSLPAAAPPAERAPAPARPPARCYVLGTAAKQAGTPVLPLPSRLTLTTDRAGDTVGRATWVATGDDPVRRSLAGHWTTERGTVTVVLPAATDTLRLELRDADGALRGVATSVRAGVTRTSDVVARRGCE